MDEEPKFLDNESLFDNLDEAKAKRVLKWLILVYSKAPSDVDHAIYLAREINTFFGIKEDDEMADVLYEIEPEVSTTFTASEVHDLDIFDRIMSQLEEKYES